MPEIPTRRRVPARLVVAAAALGAILFGLGLYGTLSLRGNRACAASGSAVALDVAARGELAAFRVLPRPEPLPPLAFTDPAGRPATLADFKGRTVLLNLWATWCEPCRREMPALDALQGALGGPDFTVVAVNIDTRELDRPKAWLDRAGVARLAYYADPQARIFQDLRRAGLADGMPTTLLVDPQGCQLGRLAGPAEWASPDGIGLIRVALGR